MFPSILSLEMGMEMRSEQDKELPTGEIEAAEQLYHLGWVWGLSALLL